MSLEELRKKVVFHNSIDVWIAACTERNLDWSKPENYQNFISYLLAHNLNLKAFTLCAHEAGETEQQKTKFADALHEIKDPTAAVYTIKLNDTAISIINKYDFQD